MPDLPDIQLAVIRNSVRAVTPNLDPVVPYGSPKVYVPAREIRGRYALLKQALEEAARQFVALADAVIDASGAERRAFAIAGVTRVLDVVEAGVDCVLPRWTQKIGFGRLRDGIGDMVQRVYEARKKRKGKA